MVATQMTLRITIHTQIWQPQPLGHVYMTLEKSHTHFCSLFCIHKTSLKNKNYERELNSSDICCYLSVFTFQAGEKQCDS